MELRFLRCAVKNKIINLVKWVAKIHKSVLLWLLEKIVHGHRRLWGDYWRRPCLS